MAYGTGQLDPNQQAPKDSTSKENPPDEEVKLAAQIDKLFQKYARHRAKYDRFWIDNYKTYRGLDTRKQPGYKNKEFINMVFRVIRSQTAVMMDLRPTVGFLPQEPSDLEIAEIMNQVFESDWERNDWIMDLMEIMLDGEFYSIAYGHCCYDTELAGKRAGISWESVDPLSCYPDPDARDINKKSEGFIHAEPVDIDKLKKKYAGHKYVELIKPDLEDVSIYKRNVETLHKRKNTDLDLPVDREAGSMDVGEGKDRALVITAYLKPSDTEEIEKDDELGEKLYITRMKYPQGRKVVKINQYIFEDDSLEYDDLEFPFQRYVVSPLPREFYGMSTLDVLKGPQATFNKLVNWALDVLQLMGNPVWLVPLTSGVNPRKLTNEPGLVVEHNEGAPPIRTEGVQLQPYVLQMIDRMEKWFNDTAQDQDVSRGVNPTGVTANAAIENLLDAAQKPVKQKLRNIDTLLTQFGRQYLSRAFQFYTVPEIYRLTGKDGAQKYFKFYVTTKEQPKVDESGAPITLPDGSPQVEKKKVAVIREYEKNDAQQMVPKDSQKEFEIRGKFDLKVDTISGLPFSKADTEQKVLNLFDRQIIDAEEVLSRLDYPNKEKILMRMQEKAAAAAEQAPQPA